MPVNVGAVRVPQNGGRVLAVAAGASQSVDSGVQMMDAMMYPVFAFQLLGTFTNMSVQFFGTFDPALYAYYLANIGTWQGAQSAIPATSWFPLLATTSSSAGPISPNPLTTAGQLLETKGSFLAVRCVITSTSAGTGICTVIGMARA